MKMIFAVLAVALLLLLGCAGTQSPQNPPAKNSGPVAQTCQDAAKPACPAGADIYSTTDRNGCLAYHCRDIVPAPVVNNSSSVPPVPPENSNVSQPPAVNNSSNTTPPAAAGGEQSSGNSTQPPVVNNSSQITPPPVQQVKEFTVEVYQFGFNPPRIDVNKGDRVRIILKSRDTGHGFAIPQFGIDIKAPAGGTATGEFVADQEGSFIFHCSVFCGDGHGTMSGVVVVK